MKLRTLIIALTGAATVPLAPTHAEVMLGEQVVTALGYAADSRDTPQAVEVLRPDSPGANLIGKLMHGRPGLAIQSDGAWGQNPVLRGLKKESVVLMVDGVRMNSAQPQGALASFVDLGLLDRVEVVKGPGSVLYGSGAMGGVVNMLTPDAAFSAEPRVGGRASLNLGSVDRSLAGALLLQRSNADQALLLGAAGREVGDYRSPAERERNTGYRTDSLLFKGRQRLSDDASLRLNLQRHRDHGVWYPGSARTGAGIAPALGVVTIHSPEQRRELYELGADLRLGDGVLSAEIHRQEVYRQIRAHSARLERDYMLNNVNFATNGVRARYLVPLGDHHLLSAGVESWRMKADPERHMYGNPPLFNLRQRNDPFRAGEIDTTGVFVQDELMLGRTRLIAGLRFDRVRGTARRKGSGAAAQTSGLTSTDHSPSWSLGAVHPLSATLNLYANLGRSFRSADLRERFEDAPRGDGYYHVGNPQLDPERSTSMEVGLKGGDGALQYQLAGFYTRIDDYIAGRVGEARHPGSGLPLKHTENLDKVSIHGVEGSASMPVGRFVADAAFTWLRGRNHQDREPLYQMPPPEITLGLGQRSAHGFHWHAQLRAVAAQKRVAKRFSNGTEDATAGFVTADAELGWRFGAAGAFSSTAVTASVRNLANKRYHEHLAEGMRGRELLAPGRGIHLSLSGSF